MSIRARNALLCVVLAVAAATVFATSQDDAVTGADTEPGDLFGWALDVDGDWLVVGAIFASLDQADDEEGAVYAFKRQPNGTYSQTQKIVSDTSCLGESISLDGDRFAVTDDAVAETVFVYLRSGDTWALEDSFVPATFVDKVALSGDTLLVGSESDDNQQVFVYTRSGSDWTESATLTPSGAGDEFGETVALDGTTAVVGAPEESTTGAAYVFRNGPGGWSQEQRIVPPGAPGAAGFGGDVAVDGDTLVVSAPLESFGSVIGSGAVYVYTRDEGTWTLQARLTTPASASDDLFGLSVGIDGDLLLATAPGREGPTGEDGTAYLFRRFGATWSDAEELLPTSRRERLVMGVSGAVSGTLVAVGAMNGGLVVPTSPGEALVFDEAGTIQPPPPPDSTVDGFILPATAALRLPSKRRAGPGLVARGVFDTGRLDIDFEAPGVLRIGSFEAPHAGFVTRGRGFQVAVPRATMIITPARTGSSRATFNVAFDADLSGDVARNGANGIGVSFGADEISGEFELGNGSFSLRKDATAVVEPLLATQKVRATLAGASRDSLNLVLQFATPGAAPATAPDVSVSFGGFSVTVPGASFRKLKRDRWQFRGNQDGVRRVLLDYRRGRVSVVAKKVGLGSFGAGVVDLLALISLDDDQRAVRFRGSRRGKRLKY